MPTIPKAYLLVYSYLSENQNSAKSDHRGVIDFYILCNWIVSVVCYKTHKSVQEYSFLEFFEWKNIKKIETALC